VIRSALWALLILGLLLLFQTTVLSYLALWGIKPNVLFLVFVILATQNGSLVSQSVGFILGIIVDVVSLAPLGYHAFLFSLAGYLFGLGSGKVYFDPLFMPILLGLMATAYDSFGGLLLNLLFRLDQPISSFLHLGLLFQLFINLLMSPLIFWLYSWSKERFQNQRRGFGV